MYTWSALSVLMAIGLAACGGGSSSPAGDAGDNVDIDRDNPVVGEWYKPPVGATWHWQLQGPINTAYDVALYDVDLFDTPAQTIASLQGSGKRVICYFSAGSYEEGRPDSGEFLPADLGRPLDDWPGERWLDIRSETVRRIMLERLNLAATKGCDGVEPDNVDGYQNHSGFTLRAADQLRFNVFIANAAHSSQLSVGLKNDLDQIDTLLPYFDFAVNEQCHHYDECDAVKAFITHAKPVFHAEYSSVYVDDSSAFQGLCQDASRQGFSTLVLPLLLDDSSRLVCP